MKIGPSSEVHCDPCSFSGVHEQDTPMQLQLIEVQTVKILASQLAAKENLKLPAVEKISRSVYARHQAALVCARTILRGECPLFIYAEDAAGHKTVRNRPPDMEGFEGLKSI